MQRTVGVKWEEAARERVKWNSQFPTWKWSVSRATPMRTIRLVLQQCRNILIFLLDRFIREHHSLRATPLSRNVHNDKFPDKCLCHKEQGHFRRVHKSCWCCTNPHKRKKTENNMYSHEVWHSVHFIYYLLKNVSCVSARPLPTTRNIRPCIAGCSQFITYLRCATLSFSCFSFNCFLSCSTPSLSS